jgi:glutamine synthetase
MTPREVLALCREKDVKAVDLRFTDLWGAWQHITIPVGKLEEGVFEDGLGFDGAGAGGSLAVHESSLLLVPQPDTAFLDPFAAAPAQGLICDVQDPGSGEPYSRDPRHIAVKAANYLKHTGIADVACFGPEAQFYVFDEARFQSAAYDSFYHLGGKRPDASAAADPLADLLTEMMQALLDCGVQVEAHRRASGSGRQCEIGLAYQPLVTMGDWMQLLKYCVKSAARRHNQVATFMPQPLVNASGSALHVHFSLWKDDEPLFAGGSYAGLSDVGRCASGGILRHAPALLALTNPTTNSYKRLAAGADGPVPLVYSQWNRSAACRIPPHGQSPKAKRIEFRCPDPTCNPYLAFAAITMAAIDGIQLKLSPGQPVDRNLSGAALAEIPTAPATLDEALIALERDCDFLLKGDVFTPDVIQAWTEHKRKHEVAALRLRPHPYEFCMYFDA